MSRSSAVLMPFVAKRVFGHEPLEITAEWGLRDLRQGMTYTLCNSLQCQECGALFLDYRFTDEQMASLYNGYRNKFYTLERDHYEPGYAAVAEHYQGREPYIADVETWLAPHLPPFPTVLDWGGGSGINTPFLMSHTLLHVHDISAVDTVDGAERFNPISLVQCGYDLIVCSQVLEHVPSPLALIQELLPVLGPQTLLYIEVPYEALISQNQGSLHLARLKRHWHEHINFFTHTALRRLVQQSGLEIVDECFLPVDLGWRKAQIMAVLVRLAKWN